MAAGTRPPRVTQTTASNGPEPASRQASARASRWNWSQETGKIFSGCSMTVPPDVTGMSGGRQRRLHLRQHRLDGGTGGGELLRVARPHHHIGVGAEPLVEEGIAADHHLGMLFGDGAEL